MAKRILIFGYSIAYGAWDEEGGWATRLRKYLDKRSLESGLKNNFQIYNMSISGQTLDELNISFESEAERRIRNRDDFIFFEFGSNDVKILKGNKLPNLSQNQIRQYIQKIIKKAQELSDNVIFLGLTPVDESKTTPWKSRDTRKNKYIEQFDEIIRTECGKNEIPFVDVLNEFKKLEYQQLLQDGLHPSTKGHNLIYKIVKEHLEERGYI